MSNGKGSKPRPTNLKEFGANYDSIFWKKQYIGKTIDELSEKLNNTKWRYRTIDGKGCMGTCDFRRDRLNFDIINGKIVDVSIG
ncbi:MAG: hypothetical protein EKK57_05870 [Proteobacteria bacterium]|nr:MAG: hypothetical protein EKK57_05870 [Pseudomonadota bacterium]